jgi:hypothetical protein
MAIMTLFVDTDNTEMDCSLNNQGKVYIYVGPSVDDGFGGRGIELDKEDVVNLIKILTDIEVKMSS